MPEGAARGMEDHTLTRILVVEDDEAKLPKEHELRDGLAPPAANIRNRKWRKRMPENLRGPKALQRVEEELQALLLNKNGAPPPIKECVWEWDSDTSSADSLALSDPEDGEYEKLPRSRSGRQL